MEKPQKILETALVLVCVGIIAMVTAMAFEPGYSKYCLGAVAQAAGGNVASANGSGHSGNLTLSFGAFDHGEGNITGQATFIDGEAGTKVTVDIEWRTVNGNQASLGGTVMKSTDIKFGPGKPVTFFVVDNGEGAGAVADLFSAPVIGGCGIQSEAPVPFESDAGNIQVRFYAPDKDCNKCPAGTHCAGNGECVGGGGNHCKMGYKDCCGTCVPDDTTVCPACPK